MADSYYIRIRGEVKGPLSREQIVSQIRKKRLGRHHELSADAIHWERAGEIAGLFEPAAVPKEETQQNAYSGSVDDAAATVSAPAAGTDAGWYYAKGRNNIGPVTADELRAMLATSRLLGTDRVWHNTLEDWTPAHDLPQFMGSVADPGTNLNTQPEPRSAGRKLVPKATFVEVLMGTSQGASLPDDAIYKYPNLTRYLLIAENALRIIFIILLLAGTTTFVVIVGQNVENMEAPLLIGAVIGGGFALVFQAVVVWLLFISCLAVLELIRVLIKIEDNTSQSVGNFE